MEGVAHKMPPYRAIRFVATEEPMALAGYLTIGVDHFPFLDWFRNRLQIL